MNYKITADSTCDLSPELLEQYGLGLTPLYVQLGEKTYRDGVDIFPDDIYAHVANGGDLATTAAVNLADYVRLFPICPGNTTLSSTSAFPPIFPAAIRTRASRRQSIRTSTL